MDVFEQMGAMGHEQVVFCRDDEVGLKAIIAIHDTTLGPALGGCRLYPYATEADALRDVLRLSRGMTYKAAVAGLDLGGGKAVIIGDPSIKSEGLFRAFGRFVESLHGRYITAEDMNTTVEDMNFIRRETRHVTGATEALGGSGDPSPVTAWGIFHGIRAALEVVFGSPDPKGRTVAIQGCGSVGSHLAEYLHDAGAELVYTDLDEQKVARCIERFGGRAVDGDAYWELEVDVLAPCAIGGVLNRLTIPRIRAPIVAGGANNQLEDEHADGRALMEAGITYVPDYVINAGGLINVNAELHGFPRSKAMDDTAAIFDKVKMILNLAAREGIPTQDAADHIAEARIEQIGRVGHTWLPR